MNTDIRISVSFKNHRKRAKLRMILGDRATDYLLDLWLTASMDRPDGDLRGLDAMDIAIMAGWQGDPQTFVGALVEVGFLDVTTVTTNVERTLNDVTTTVTTNLYSLHDWPDHNGYACSANDRSGKSRFSRMAKTHPVLYQELKQKGYEAISSEEFRRLTSFNERSTTVERSLTNRSSPSPSPLPSIKEEVTPPVPYQQVFDSFNKFCPGLPKVHAPTATRCALVKVAWEKYASNDGGPLRVFDAVFKKAQASDYLTGRAAGYNGRFFKAKFDWLFEEEKLVAVLEGAYDNQEAPVDTSAARPKRGAELITPEEVAASYARAESEDVSERF